MSKLIEEYNKVNKLFKEAEEKRDIVCKEIKNIARQVMDSYTKVREEYLGKKLYPHQKSIEFTDRDLTFKSILVDVTSIDKEYITFSANDYWPYGGYAEGYIKFPVKFIETPPTEEQIRAEYDASLRRQAEEQRAEKLKQIEKLQKELDTLEYERE